MYVSYHKPEKSEFIATSLGSRIDAREANELMNELKEVIEKTLI